MDLRLSADPYESFRIFQGRILEQYLAMSGEFNFLVIDANKPIEAQQTIVRELVARKIDLSGFKLHQTPSNGFHSKPRSNGRAGTEDTDRFRPGLGKLEPASSDRPA